MSPAVFRNIPLFSSLTAKNWGLGFRAFEGLEFKVWGVGLGVPMIALRD